MQPTPYLCLTLTPGSRPQPQRFSANIRLSAFLRDRSVTVSPTAQPELTSLSRVVSRIVTFLTLASQPHPIRATRALSLVILSRPFLNHFTPGEHIYIFLANRINFRM